MINVRLWIEYCLVGVLVASAGLAVANHFRVQVQAQKVETVQQELEKSENTIRAFEDRLETAETINSAQENIIMDIANQRRVDGERILELIDTYSSLSQSDKVLRNRLILLEKDDDAKRYLDNPIPDSVGCVYDGTCKTPTPPADPGKDGAGKGLPSKAPPSTMRSDPETEEAS